MAYEHKPESGSIWRNEEREKDTQPHMKGSALIGGVEYWVSAWTNTSPNTGERYQSLKFTRKDEAHDKGMSQVNQAMNDQGAAHAEDFPDDDIPF